MAVGVLMMAPGMGPEQYQQANERMFGSGQLDGTNAPDGLLVHSAGPAEGGWYVYDIWESREAFERFAEGQLMPVLREIAGGDPGGAPPQFFEIANLVRV